MTQQKKPAKPTPTTAPTKQLLAHYNSQVPAYNAAILLMDEKKRPETGLQAILPLSDFVDEFDVDVEQTRGSLIELIRRQNHRLGRHIKARSHELLLEHARGEDGEKLLKDGKYTVGHTYQHILETLAAEFPEASTSVACLRWYVVHMRSDADDEGLAWPDLPQWRPRSSKKAL